MIFLDFEASAAMGGFPIEVGFCVVEPDRTMRSAAKLIRHDEWLDDFSRWDWRAQEIHHIDRDQLIEAGEPPQEVMSWLNAELGGMVACCDSHMDGIWPESRRPSGWKTSRLPSKGRRSMTWGMRGH